MDTFDDNLCVWRCLAIYKRHACGEKIEWKKETLDLARECYGDNKLKGKDVRPARLVDFEGIAGHHNVNYMLYEQNKDRAKDAGSIWWLVYGTIQHKNDLTTKNMGLLGGPVFTSRRWMCFASDGNVKVVGRYLHETSI